MLNKLRRLFGGQQEETPVAASPKQPPLPPPEALPPKPEVRVFKAGADYPCHKPVGIPVDYEFLNPMQSCFLDNYDPGRNAVVEAPTGIGKTVIAFIASRTRLAAGKRVIMTAPTKELVRGLFQDMQGVWGGRVVGLAGSDDSDLEGKHVVICTPEGYLAALRANKEWAIDADLLIIDEAHNLLDPSRGGELDVAQATFRMRGGKVLCMSGTFPVKEELAEFLGADLFMATYVKTKINLVERQCFDDLQIVKDVPHTPLTEHQAKTKAGYRYNTRSERLAVLKEELKTHEGKKVIVFCPSKAQGFTLSEILGIPFHCADVDEQEKRQMVADFRDNNSDLKVLLATNTLSQGVNTPADVVIVAGIRRYSYYLDSMEVAQMMGRAGRGRDEADAVILGDVVELFHAKKPVLTSGLPVPVGSMLLTGLLALDRSRRSEIIACLRQTFSGSRAEETKLIEQLDRVLQSVKRCGLLDDQKGLHLTPEGALVGRYYFQPEHYAKFKTLALALRSADDISDGNKGLVLLAAILPSNAFQKSPLKYSKEVALKLIAHKLANAVDTNRVGCLRSYIAQPKAMSPYFQYNLREAERWLSMLRDMEKYRIHAEAPGRRELEAGVALMQKAVRIWKEHEEKREEAERKKAAERLRKAEAAAEELSLFDGLGVDQEEVEMPPPPAPKGVPDGLAAANRPKVVKKAV